MQRVLLWCDEAFALADEVDFEAFLRERTMQYAVSKCVEQIGEAAGRVLRDHPDFAASRPDLPLAAAYSMRNRLVHAYDGVHLEMLWTTARDEAPALARQLRTALETLDAGGA